MNPLPPWVLGAWARVRYGGLTRAADKLGVSISSLSHYVSGKAKIPAWLQEHVLQNPIRLDEIRLNSGGRPSRPAMAPDEFSTIRKATGMNRVQLAEKLGVTKTSVHFYELGKRSIPQRIADIVRALAAETRAA